ncbi:MAG: TIGR04283 family arsenosugar biosynthesis glycosyltransferase [Candidatus Binatus sp.]|uniref:TIGR04283 family arsenosugar biosynthesis glycosyltransferase n=1 Tax=Candidatus Binatus sp. TaxID=2811406 RepID=UPI003CABDCF3
MKTLSAIVPMLNEAASIASTLGALRRGAPDAEIVVVDGGSIDSSVAIAQPLCDTLIGASRGRAHQMNAGARASHGDALVFVHADTLVPSSFAADIASALSDPAVVGGRFDVRLDSAALAYRVIGAMISLRSRISRTGTGDQAIFVRREVFDRLGGFPDLELCEDLEFARRLKRAGRIACLRARVTTSARRWNRDGVIRTIVRMWLIRAMYLMGVAPARLKRMYSDTRQP